MFSNNPKQNLYWLGWALHAGGLAVGLLAALVLVKFVYQPIDAAREQRAIDSSRLERLLTKANQVREEHSKLSTDLEAIKRQRESLEGRIPEGPREAEFLAQVTQVAQDVGIHIRDYRPGGITTDPNYSRMEIGLSCEGSYAAVCNFLDRLDRLPRLTRVTRLDINSASSAQFYPMNMTMVIFFGLKTPPVGKTPVAGFQSGTST